MKFNRKKFFDAYRVEFGGLTQAQVNGLEQLLGFIENDRYVTTVEVAAFLLGTTKHEAADTYKPIHEYGGKAYFIKRYGGQTRKGKELGNDTPEEGYDYAGKGYPQTTGESNYERLEDALRIEYPEIIADFERRTGKRFDLTVGDQPNDKSDPQNMLDPAIAYVSMSYGSRVGLFTGRKLSQYDLKTDVGRKGSRRIINGQDKATLIAGYIAQFIKILKSSKVSGSSQPTAVQTATDTPSPSEKPQNSETPTNIEAPVNQIAEQIINTGDTATPTPAPVDVTLNAPQGMGSVQTATKVTVLGITVPPFILVVVETIKGWISDGFLDAKEIGNTVVSLIKDNSKYILIAVGLVVVVIIIKKITRELIFLVTVITHAIPGWNSITVIAPEKVEVEKKWYQFWK